jgi:acyl-CoA hydrolase
MALVNKQFCPSDNSMALAAKIYCHNRTFRYNNPRLTRNAVEAFLLHGKDSNIMQAKTPSQSAVESRYLVMPNHANPYGTAFGGAIVAWIDMIAAMVARRHCAKEAVTAGIDSLIFKEAIYVGDHVVLKAAVNYTGRTSMEVGVRVIRENPCDGSQVTATKAHLTFVALGEDKKPVEVPPISPETADEKRRYENAKLRVQSRKDLLKKIKANE